MKTRTILKKLAVLIIFIFITNIQAQPNPCGCPSERGNLDELDETILRWGNIMKADTDTASTNGGQLGAASCHNCSPLALMVIDYLNKGEDGDKNPFLNKQLYDDFYEFSKSHGYERQQYTPSTIYENYLQPKYPGRTMITKEFPIDYLTKVKKGKVPMKWLSKFEESKKLLYDILDKTEVGDSGIIGLQWIVYDLNDLSVHSNGAHAVAFFTFFENGIKKTQVFNLQDSNGLYISLDAERYLKLKYQTNNLQYQSTFVPRSILILKKA